MIVGGYTLDLYCDNESLYHNYHELKHSFAHQTYGQCAREARRVGRVFKRDGRVLCPRCSGKVKK